MKIKKKALLPIEKVVNTLRLDISHFFAIHKLRKLYVKVCVFILLTTSGFWAILGARLHQSNADQLVNSYLLDSVETFKKASIPGQHSFLFKWPLFWLVNLFGSSNNAYISLTVIVVLASVSTFAYILYKINSRPHIFGTICLALASVLLLVPAAPYAGGILPVNMAMLTTRNLEYVLYIGGVILFIRSKRLKSLSFILATIIMSLLFASDKLFLSLFSGATAIGIVFYLATRNWCMVKHYLGWTGSGVLTWAMASFFVRIINHLHITNFSSTLAPYSLIHSSHDLILGIIYGVLGLFTNFGANPGFDASTLRNLPHITIERLGSFGQQGYVVNLLILCLGVYTLLRLLLNSLSRKKVKEIKVLDSPTKLSIFLIWSSFAAAGSFVLTDHYYFVDARYLTITMFTIFICAATYFRKKLFSRRFFYISNWVLVLTIGLSMYGAYQIYNSQNIALNDINTRNHTVVEILKARNFDTLVGDYWRVIPIRQESKKHLSVTPLSDCTTTRDMLSSKLWQPDLTKNNFAYLLSLDKSLTDFPSCSLEQVIAKYGLPYKSNVVSGSRAHPKELLLFYYRETSTNFNAVDKNSSATVTPLALDSIDNEYCTVPTIIQIIAHQDDDLLFMNPDLLHDIKDGNCVRTVYLTAGDSGADSHYWLGRESGAEDAYSSMLGVDSVWEERLIRLKSGQLVTIASPRSNAKISLIFMRLPDGNVRGGGFNSQHFSSITKLQSGIINSLKTTDNESSYTLDELQKALVSLLIHYGPSSIRTQSSHEVVSPNPDHSDHITASKLAKKAYANYELLEYQNTTMIPFTSYVGYPIKDREKNVFGVDLVEKLKAFKAYAKNDNAVCTPVQSCWQKSNYSLFMSRQYHADD